MVAQRRQQVPAHRDDRRGASRCAIYPPQELLARRLDDALKLEDALRILLVRIGFGSLHNALALLVWTSLAWPASLLLFAVSTSYSVSLALVFAAGLTQAIVWTVIATLILGNTTQPMRGRVMGLRTGVVISLPIEICSQGQQPSASVLR